MLGALNRLDGVRFFSKKKQKKNKKKKKKKTATKNFFFPFLVKCQILTPFDMLSFPIRAVV